MAGIVERLQPAILAGLILATINLPMLYTKIFLHRLNDSNLHIRQVRIMAEGNILPAFVRARPLWHLVVLKLSELTGLSYEWSALIVALLAVSLTAAVLAVFVQIVVFKNFVGFKEQIITVIAAVSLMLVAPIAAFQPLDGLYYLGYIGITNYHNATINFLKPFVVIQMFLLYPLIIRKRTNIGLTLIAASITAMSAYVKPNFLICLLPALFLLVIYDIYKKQKVDFRYIALGFFLPGIIIMTMQFMVTYKSDEAGMTIMPFAVMQSLSGFLVGKFLLSIVFPLVVTVVFFKEARKDRMLWLSWLVFATGAAYTYFLAETGERFSHANFGWSGEIALFYLFICTLVFAMRTLRENPEYRKWQPIVLLSFFVHVAAGIAYYVHMLKVDTFNY